MKHDKQQETQGVVLIDRTYKVRKPNGEVTEVNRFDMNLTLCANPQSWIQCKDTSWIPACNLEVLA